MYKKKTYNILADVTLACYVPSSFDATLAAVILMRCNME